jgi:hypothetical protein
MITLKNVKGLERHAYAPEMNKLHLVGGKIYRVPQQTNINQAITYVNSRLL